MSKKPGRPCAYNNDTRTLHSLGDLRYRIEYYARHQVAPIYRELWRAQTERWVTLPLKQHPRGLPAEMRFRWSMIKQVVWEDFQLQAMTVEQLPVITRFARNKSPRVRLAADGEGTSVTRIVYLGRPRQIRDGPPSMGFRTQYDRAIERRVSWLAGLEKLPNLLAASAAKSDRICDRVLAAYSLVMSKPQRYPVTHSRFLVGAVTRAMQELFPTDPKVGRISHATVRKYLIGAGFYAPRSGAQKKVS
jgi:hypothetical protein